MTAGRPYNFPPCPDCHQPIESSHSPYYKCGCRGYIVREGNLCPTRKRAKPKAVKKVVQGQVRKPMEWWEFEELQNARPERVRE